MTLTLDIAMLGPSGAGKTSLLASMYSQFASVTATTKVVLAAQDQATSAELSRYRADLDKLGRQLVVREPGIGASRAFREHVFSLRGPGKSDGSRIDLRFSDYPGEWLTNPEAQLEPSLEMTFQSSDILVLAIDTPAMLAEGGKWHQDLNHPQRMLDIVKDWLDSKSRRALILVPLKCEAWAANDTAAGGLMKDVEDSYRDLINLVASRDNHPSVIISPVQTVGSILFDGFQVTDGAVTARFRGRRPNDRYDPQWTAEPVRLIVKHALMRYKKKRSVFKKLTDRWTKDGGHLRNAFEKLEREQLGPSKEVVSW